MVTIRGARHILFHCFAGCDQQSVLSALAREGFEAPALFSASATTNGPEPTSTRKPSAAALRIWRDAQPLRASPAKEYLESRGILAASPALRFHPRTPLGPKGRTRFLPALIAAVSLDEGPVAVHRTFLSGNTKAAFDKPKRALGALGESAVRLFAPASGKLGLAEGIESAMSAYALTGIPVWATLGNERFGLVSVPESVGAPAARAAARRLLIKAMLVDLPSAPEQKRIPLFVDFAEEFWTDYSPHWKPSTRTSSRSRIDQLLIPQFGSLPVDMIARSDINRWRDTMTKKEGSFNRTIPIMSVMMQYAEKLG